MTQRKPAGEAYSIATIVEESNVVVWWFNSGSDTKAHMIWDGYFPSVFVYT